MSSPDATQLVNVGASDTIAAGAAETLVDAAHQAASAPLERGALIGRYVILAHLGAGGMGVVYAAYDPELDRKIALKLLRADHGPGTNASAGRSRLLREAQALARVSHPNIVAIHDVGTFRDRVWLAMEYIDGMTLGAWLKSQARREPEILRVMLAVGQGLIAAHAAGLVHRDLKPDNIMVGADGRVRVMDFGLARAAGRPAPLPARPARVEPADGSATLTRVGAVMGTPAYMAPEQWNGDEVDARADQFAFCVTLWEALVGERPFVGGTLIELATHVMHGERQRLKGSAGVPAGVRRALLRGLEVRPEGRFPSMEALLAALERGQAASRWRRVVVGLGVACAVVAGGAGWHLSDRAGRVRACEAAGAEIAEVWNPAAAAALKEALLATGASHAARTFDKAVPWIDRWTADWSHMRAELCTATNVEGTRPRELDALSTACLEERREELSARLAAIGEGGATAVLRAVPMFSGLSQLGPCADRATLERRPALPTEDAVRDRVLVVRRDLIRAMGLHAAGRSADGLARAEAALAAAESLAYPPLVAEALLTVGGLAVQTHELERAEDTLTRAYVEAGSLGADDVAVQAVMQLVGTVGYLRGRPAEGLLWSRSAEMLLRKLGLVDALPGAALAIHLAAVHQLQGTYAEAVRLFGRALEIRERELGPTHPEVASALNNLGETYRLQGDIETSLRLQERALAIYEEQLGPDHPLVAASLNNLGLIREARGELELARGLYERAMRIREEQLGPDHIDVAVPLSNLSNVRDSQGAHDEAQRLLERAVAIHEKALGTEHPRLASLLVNLAAIHLEQGRFDAAQPLAERALRITESALGPDHPDVAYSLDMLGALALARGRPADAIPPLERALVIHAGAAPLRLAQTRGLLARALWGAPVGAGRDRGRAGDLAGQALAVLRAAGDAHTKDVAELEAWLRSREP